MTLYADNTQSEGESSSSLLLEMMYGYQKSQALFVAAKLGIADILSNGSISGLEQISSPHKA